MKILFLSSDEHLFREGSDVRSRMAGFGATAESVHAVVLAKAPKEEGSRLAPNVFLYPAVGRGRFERLKQSYRAASKLLSSGERWIVSAQDPFEIGLIGLFLKIRFGVPLELQVHTDIGSLFFKKESLTNRIRVLLGNFTMRHADSVRVVSERIRTEIIAKGILAPEKVTMLPVFVDPTSWRKTGVRKFPAGKNGRITILSLSRLSREKNIPLALRAIERFAKVYPDILLRIVGEGPEEAKLKKMAVSLGIEKNVSFEQWTSDVSSVYEKADALLITSNYEGYGRTALEAMRAGVPVVMTNVGIAGDIVRDGETGFVMPIGSLDAILKTLKIVIEDAKRRDAVRKKAEKVIAKLPKREAYFKLAKANFEKMKPKLCYVFPNYRKDDATHFSYQRTFVRALSSEYEMRLITEKGTPDILGYNEVSAEGSTFRLFTLFIKARLLGYRTFYIHYSFRAAFLAKLVRGRVYYWNCGEPWKYTRKAVRELFERHVYRKIDFLVTGTEGLKNAYARHYHLLPSRIAVMPNWIEEDVASERSLTTKASELRKKLEIAPGDKVVLFVHRLSKRKGAHYLPRIIAKVKQRAILIVVGEGPEGERIREEARNMKVIGQMRLVGAVPREELGRYYALADAFVMPSDEEGFPHVLLEAFAFGVPFVASDVGGVKDIVPQGMYNNVVPAGNMERVALRLDSLLSLSPSERRGVKTLLTEWVTRFSLESAVSAFRNIVG